ncbi:Acetolactate synthase-like protein [Varanus komodoensis]|nr:Acetolactate synthase-like protein [Varanus komodoensis]
MNPDMIAATSVLEGASAWLLPFFGILAVILLGAAHKLGLIYQLWHQVNPKSTRHGGEIVAEVLKAHGVHYLFTLVGGHISPILVASEKMGIRIIDTRHEATAVFAADAVARLSGTVGVAVVTAGPGVTNTVTAMKNAQMAESPVLLIGGAASTLQKGRGALQDIDQLSLFKPLCKFCASVKTVRDIAPVLRKAIAFAQCDTPGPVFVELPLDVLYPYHLVERELFKKDTPKSLTEKIVNWYLRRYLMNLFAGAWEVQNFSPLPVSVPKATKEQVQQCVELISRAKKPVILLGSQVTLPPTPVKKLRDALDELGIPCFLGGMARGMLGKNSPLHIRQKRHEALKEADVVILAGTVCDFRLSYGRILSKRSKIIAVNRNREQLLKNAHLFWTPHITIKGDAGSFLVHLSQELKGYSCPQDWKTSLKEADCMKEKENREKAEVPTEQHLNPLKLLHHVDCLLPEDSLLIADGGDFVASAAYIVKPREPLSWLDPGKIFAILHNAYGYHVVTLCSMDTQLQGTNSGIVSACLHLPSKCSTYLISLPGWELVPVHTTPACVAYLCPIGPHAPLRMFSASLCFFRIPALQSPCEFISVNTAAPMGTAHRRPSECAPSDTQPPHCYHVCHLASHPPPTSWLGRLPHALPDLLLSYPACTAGPFHHLSRAFGTLGVGGGFALGAKLCRPDSEVWIIYGDGSLGFSIMEFDSFVRHKTPVIALVGNDACWSQISREQVPMLGSNVACGLEYLDYHVVAEGLGGKGFLLSRQNEEQMDDIIKAAQSECRSGRPVLLNALIGKTNFREGSISV